MLLRKLIAAMTAGILGLAAGVASAADLVVYSGRSDSFVKPVIQAFTEETGISVTLHAGSATELLNKLRLEGARTPADLFISNDAGTLQVGADMDLFQSLPKPIAESVPAQFRGPQNEWLGLSARARVLVINRDSKLVQGVDSVFDLADPRLRDRIAITHSANESFIAGVTVYLESAGEQKTRDWLEGLKANAGRSVFNKHSAIVDAVARGRKDVGLVNHYYIFRHLDQNPDAPIEMVMPDQGSDGMGVAWNVAGVAIPRHAPQPEAAQRLVEFLTSEQGQRMFAEVNREYPTRSGTQAADELPPADDYKVAEVPMAQLGRQRDATLDLIEAVGMP